MLLLLYPFQRQFNRIASVSRDLMQLLLAVNARQEERRQLCLFSQIAVLHGLVVEEEE